MSICQKIIVLAVFRLGSYFPDSKDYRCFFRNMSLKWQLSKIKRKKRTRRQCIFNKMCNSNYLHIQKKRNKTIETITGIIGKIMWETNHIFICQPKRSLPVKSEYSWNMFSNNMFGNSLSSHKPCHTYFWKHCIVCNTTEKQKLHLLWIYKNENNLKLKACLIKVYEYFDYNLHRLYFNECIHSMY